jgi:hypothetical protein
MWAGDKRRSLQGRPGQNIVGALAGVITGQVQQAAAAVEGMKEAKVTLLDESVVPAERRRTTEGCTIDAIALRRTRCQGRRGSPCAGAHWKMGENSI